MWFICYLAFILAFLEGGINGVAAFPLVPHTKSSGMHTMRAACSVPMPRKMKSIVILSPPSLVALSAAVDMSHPEDPVSPKYNHDHPRFYNSHGFRALAGLSTLYFVGCASGVAQSPILLIKSKQTLATLHLLAFGVWFGSIFYSTFVGGITMVKNLPRPMFAKVQAKLFPKFFNLCTVAIILELVTISGLPLSLRTSKVMKQLLVGSLIATLSNVFFFGPKTTETMNARVALEEISGGKTSMAYKRESDKFMKYHAGSSIANLIAMCGAVGHAMQLALPFAV